MLDIGSVLKALAVKRPVFHSEADFQHALAWEIHERYPESQVRLERSPPCLNERMLVDIWVRSSGMVIPIEVKYKTRLLRLTNEDELFDLQNHVAHDVGQYDFAKDISRVERVCTALNTIGYAILLSNDSAYWSLPRKQNTCDAAFRLCEGRELGGTLEWAPHTGEGTKKGREAAIILSEVYELHWEEYSQPGAGTWGKFRYLLVQVGGNRD